MDLSISSVIPAFVRAANILLQSRVPVINLLHRYIPSTPEDGHSPSLVNRVSTNLRDTALWVVIAYQVAVVIRNVLFGTILGAIGSCFVLLALFCIVSFAHDRDRLQTDIEKKDGVIKTFTDTDTAQKKTLSKITAQLEKSQATNSELEKTSENFKKQLEESQTINASITKQLEEFKAAAAGLVTSIADIDKDHKLFAAEDKERKTDLANQIHQLQAATKIFIDAINGKQDIWDSCLSRLNDFETKIASASATLAERQAQLQGVSQRLEELEKSLTTTVQAHKNQLNAATYELRQSAQEVHEATSALTTPSRQLRRNQLPSTPQTPSTPNSRLPSDPSSN